MKGDYYDEILSQVKDKDYVYYQGYWDVYDNVQSQAWWAGTEALGRHEIAYRENALGVSADSKIFSDEFYQKLVDMSNRIFQKEKAILTLGGYTPHSNSPESKEYLYEIGKALGRQDALERLEEFVKEEKGKGKKEKINSKDGGNVDLFRWFPSYINSAFSRKFKRLSETRKVKILTSDEEFKIFFAGVARDGFKHMMAAKHLDKNGEVNPIYNSIMKALKQEQAENKKNKKIKENGYEEAYNETIKIAVNGLFTTYRDRVLGKIDDDAVKKRGFQVAGLAAESLAPLMNIHSGLLNLKMVRTKDNKFKTDMKGTITIDLESAATLPLQELGINPYEEIEVHITSKLYGITGSFQDRGFRGAGYTGENVRGLLNKIYGSKKANDFMFLLAQLRVNPDMNQVPYQRELAKNIGEFMFDEIEIKDNIVTGNNLYLFYLNGVYFPLSTIYAGFASAIKKGMPSSYSGVKVGTRDSKGDGITVKRLYERSFYSSNEDMSKESSQERWNEQYQEAIQSITIVNHFMKNFVRWLEDVLGD